MSNNITAIVNVFRRDKYLDMQINAIRNQSIPPKSIIIWNNGNKVINLSKYKNDPFFKVFDNNFNSGVWSRFIISQLADTEYVCVFDDDTIPGNNWFKNCMDCMCKKEALYGTVGLIFQDTNEYGYPLKRYGWTDNNEVTKPVDIIGHSWFFKKDWISYFVKEPSKIYEFFTVGEDMNFSYALQKYANISSYVPPHPPNDQSMFGSIPKTGWEFGCDGNSGSAVNCSFTNALRHFYSQGFNILIRRQNATSTNDFNYFLNKIRNLEPFALIRPADGEYTVLRNETLTNIDNWTFNRDGKLKDDLHYAMILAYRKNCYVGIPCGCCNRAMGKWYISTYDFNPLQTTFANIFVNKNWKNWVNFLIDEKIPINFIGPSNLPSQFIVQNYINVPLYLVNEWDHRNINFLACTMHEIKKYKNKIFLFSAGPIAKILIAHAWNEHPYNIYLDVGSSLDYFSKGSSNREYTIENSQLSQLECKFDSDLISI